MSLRTRLLVAASCLLVSAAAGVLTGLLLGRDLPNVRALEHYRPPGITVVLAADGTVLDRFGEQRRVAIPYRQVPGGFRDAVIATEDPRFFSHVGVDVFGLMRAAWRTATTRRWGVEGGSTITMQLARNLFLSPRKTLARKLQEMVLAVRIEKVYTKEEILGFYVNQVYMGHGRYGIQAASSFYFDRPAGELSLAQCALLAGILQRPEYLSPVRHPERALKRREYVLRRMSVEGILSSEEAKAAGAEELVLASSSSRPEPPLAPYFVEEVRRDILSDFGEERLYREGLRVRTTLDPALQAAANAAVHRGLLDLSRRLREIPDGDDPGEEEDRPPALPLAEGDELRARVASVSGGEARVLVSERELPLGEDAVAWTRKPLAEVLREGRRYSFLVLEADEEGFPVSLELLPEPRVEGALVALDPATGAVRALVGGFDFARSEFDRAMQARRQAGSAFKPFIYAAAFESGATPADLLLDVPTVWFDPGTELPYQPENFERDYLGWVTMRYALEESRNIPTVRLLNDLAYRPVIEMARRLGIRAPLHPYPAMGLGAFEMTLLEMTSAYSVFPNQGVRVEPHLIEEVRDREGRILLALEPDRDAEQVLSPATAFQMTSVLEGVVEHGTGRGAKRLGRPLGGKTGTTDDYSDAWFVGFTPDLTVGVWVGRDRKEPIGKRETGARAALPIWIAFLEAALAGEPPRPFPRPGSVRLVPVDGLTGLPAGLDTGCPAERVRLEVFARGREPSGTCGPRAHLRASLPYMLQRYPISDRLAIRMAPEELARLAVEGRPSPHPSPDRRSLLFWQGENMRSVPLELVPDRWDLYRLALGKARRERDAVAALRAVAEEEARLAREEDPELPEGRDALPAGVRRGWRDEWPAEVVSVRRP
jgi:penicillin-binding protein 1A